MPPTRVALVDQTSSWSPEIDPALGTVLLTGDMQRSRTEWEQDLTALGFVPWGAVTKKVKLVVAADPDSISGKARKARDYGIPIVNEAGLAMLIEQH